MVPSAVAHQSPAEATARERHGRRLHVVVSCAWDSEALVRTRRGLVQVHVDDGAVVHHGCRVLAPPRSDRPVNQLPRAPWMGRWQSGT